MKTREREAMLYASQLLALALTTADEPISERRFGVARSGSFEAVAVSEINNERTPPLLGDIRCDAAALGLTISFRKIGLTSVSFVLLRSKDDESLDDRGESDLESVYIDKQRYAARYAFAPIEPRFSNLQYPAPLPDAGFPNGKLELRAPRMIWMNAGSYISKLMSAKSIEVHYRSASANSPSIVTPVNPANLRLAARNCERFLDSPEALVFKQGID